MRAASTALTLASLLTSAGCVMPEQLAEYQKEVADVQAELKTVSGAQAALAKQVAALEAKAGSDDPVKRSEFADLSTRLDQVVRQTASTSDKVDQLQARSDRLSQDVQAAKDAARRTQAPLVPPADPGTPGGGVTAPSGAPTPSALYSSAYADFSKGNYALATQGFEEYAQRYANTELADNAMYWIGECSFSQGSYAAAIDAFDAMLEKYPESDKAAAANLKKALAFVQSNQIGQGIEQLRFVTSKYPGTDEARIATDRLAALGKP